MKSIRLSLVVSIAVPALFVMSDGSPAADWTWDGACGSSSEWHDSCASQEECGIDPVQYWVYNNWGSRSCGSTPALPGASDNVAIPSAAGPPSVFSLASAQDVTVQAGGVLEIYAQLGATTLTAEGLVSLGHDTLLWNTVVTTSGTGQIVAKHANNDTRPVPILRDVSITGDLFSTNSNVLGFEGVITNSGTIHLEGGFLAITGNTSFNGGGSLILDSAGGNYVGGTGTDGAFRLTNHNNTISGVGLIGGGSSSGTTNGIGITNHSLIVADHSSGELILRPAVTPADGFAPVVNSGTLRAESGATLRLYGDANYDNTGGVIEALGASTVALDQGAWILGGTLRTVGSGAIRSATTYWRRSWHPLVHPTPCRCGELVSQCG